MPRPSLWCSVLTILLPSSAAAELIPGDPSNYLAALATLGPGDTLMLAPGVYTDCMSIDGLHGFEDMPIVITGPDVGAPAVFDGTSCVDRLITIVIQDSSHVTLRHLEIDGGGMPVVGIQAGYGTVPVHNLTLEHLYIHDNDATQQFTGISAFCTTWDWTVRFNVLERVGLGLYLGDSDGTDPFIRGTIEHNLVLNPRGYAMQIKHQDPRVPVDGMPLDDSVTVIRHNVFIKAENASIGADARPNLLVGHLPLTGVGRGDRYEVYGNFLYQNASDTEPLFQGEGNVAFHDNILVNTFRGYGALIQPHNDVPKEIAVYRNTVLTANVGVVVQGGDPAFRQAVIGNAVYSGAPIPIEASDRSENAEGMLVDASSVFVNADPELGALDLYPRAGALAGAPLDLSLYADHLDGDLDFNGDPQNDARRGAYAGEGTNPGWRLAAEIKPPASALDGGTPGQDGGVTMEPDAGHVDAAVSSRPDATIDPVPEAPEPEPMPDEESGGCRCVRIGSTGGARAL